MMNLLEIFVLYLAMIGITLVSSIRFGTYNIQSGSNIEHIYNLTVTADAIKQIGFDIIALQEVDNGTDRHPVDQTTYLAQYNHQNPFRFFHFEKMRNFENGGYGISILSKETSIKRVLTYHYNDSTPEQCVVQEEGDYCQGLILLEITMKVQNTTDVSIYFGTTHLGIGLDGLQQSNEAKAIVRWMSEKIINTTRNPYIILMTGDYNSIPSDDAIKNGMLTLFQDLWLEDNLCKKIVDPLNVNGYTFDSLHPSKRIDYVFLYKSRDFPTEIKFKCEIQVVSTVASDHRPVALDFDFIEP